MALFRAGNEEAFRVIHDRYRKRLLAYIRQMLAGSGQDVEDVLQDVLERAYCGLRATDRDLALKAWLYRVAHNRCIDQLRRPVPMAATAPDEAESRQLSPAAIVEQRETLRRLILDVQRLPDQQRSALLLREISGMSYVELAGSLGVSVPAVKSLLVRARIGLVAAGEARDTACSEIREELALCHDRGVRPSGLARRHLRDCEQCVHFKRSVRGVSRNLAAVIPAFGPVGVLVKLLSGGGAAGSGGMLGSSGAAGGISAGGFSAGGITAGGVTAGGVTAGGVTAGGVVAGGAAGSAAAGGAVLSTSAVAGGFAAGTASHVATLVAAALVTAGGAVAVQQASTPVHPKSHSTPVHHLASAPRPDSGGAAIAPAASLSVARASADSTLAASPGSPSAAAGTTSSGSAAHHRRAKLDPVSTAVPTNSSGTEAPSDPAVGSGDSSVITPTVSPTPTVPTDTSSSDSSSSDSTDATAGTSSTTGTASGTQSTGGAAITGGGATGGASASGSSSGS